MPLPGGQELITVDDEHVEQDTDIGLEHGLSFSTLNNMYDNAVVREVVVRRQFVVQDLLAIYSSADILDSRLKVTFHGEMGDDFGGLTKEMYSSFWSEAYQTFWHGENVKVPFIPLYRARKESGLFVAFGRVLSHMAGLTSTLPFQIARSTFISLVFNVPADDDCLLDDLLMFVTESERKLLTRALRSYHQLNSKQLEALSDFFVHNDMHEMPKEAEVRQQIAAIAANVLVTKPEPFVKLMRSGLPPAHIDMFWSQMTTDGLTAFLNSQRPTAERLLNELRTEQEDLRADEARVYYYLQQFVAGLAGDDLQSFLQFVTGSVDMPRSGIVVSFFQTVATARHVVAHTCSNTLEVSTGYSSFQEFKREMLLMLHSDNCLEFSLL